MSTGGIISFSCADCQQLRHVKKNIFQHLIPPIETRIGDGSVQKKIGEIFAACWHVRCNLKLRGEFSGQHIPVLKITISVRSGRGGGGAKANSGFSNGQDFVYLVNSWKSNEDLRQEEILVRLNIW